MPPTYKSTLINNKPPPHPGMLKSSVSRLDPINQQKDSYDCTSRSRLTNSSFGNSTSFSKRTTILDGKDRILVNQSPDTSTQDMTARNSKVFDRRKHQNQALVIQDEAYDGTTIYENQTPIHRNSKFIYGHAQASIIENEIDSPYKEFKAMSGLGKLMQKSSEKRNSFQR